MDTVNARNSIRPFDSTVQVFPTVEVETAAATCTVNTYTSSTMSQARPRLLGLIWLNMDHVSAGNLSRLTLGVVQSCELDRTTERWFHSKRMIHVRFLCPKNDIVVMQRMVPPQ